MLINMDFRQVNLVAPYSAVTIELKHLSVAAYQTITRYFAKLREMEGTDGISDPELISVLAAVLPEHTKNLRGVELTVGGVTRHATPEDLHAVSGLLPVAFAVLTTLWKEAMLSEDDQGNLLGLEQNSAQKVD